MDLSRFQSQWLKHYYGPIAPTDEREQVYRRNYIYGALRLLETGFPLVQKVLGSKNFQFFAKEYALTLPGSGQDLTQFGGRFSEFLLQRRELELREQIAEVAVMEWAWDWIKRENQSVTQPLLLLNREAWFEGEEKIIFQSGEAVQVRLDYGFWPEKWVDLLSYSGEQVLQLFEPGEQVFALWGLDP